MTGSCATQSAESYARPVSRGTRRAAAVKPRPTVFSPSTPRPMGAVRSPEALLLARGPLPSGGLCHPISGKSHQTGEPWHLLCRGGKTPANRLPLERPRALWARFGVQRRCSWREARCRAAVCVTQSAGSHTRPASRGTCCAAAVKPRPIAFPSSAPAPYGRGPGSRGTTPGCSP